MRSLAAWLILTTFFAGACTEPGQTSAVGAATGGAVGAGLGAIIGSQTGSAGAGLALGAISGAGVGGAIGNALEAQEKVIQAQDEALERQERMLSAQRAEIEELKKASQDSITFKPSGSSVSGDSRHALAYDTLSHSRQPIPPAFTDAVPPAPALGAYRWQNNNNPLERVSSSSVTSLSPDQATSADCQQAQEEMRNGDRAVNSADKLFHYRRALRLCPGRAEFHNSLGEVYLQMQRREDAEYEFREALRLDPGFLPAQNNLHALKR